MTPNETTLRNLTAPELIRLAEESADPIARALSSRIAQAIEDARQEGYYRGVRDGQDG